MFLLTTPTYLGMQSKLEPYWDSQLDSIAGGQGFIRPKRRLWKSIIISCSMKVASFEQGISFLNVQSVLCSYRCRPDEQRLLDPQRVGQLIRPPLTLRLQLKIVPEDKRRQDKPHLVHRHVLAQTVARSKPKRLVRVQSIARVPGVGAEPSLRDECIGVLEVLLRVVGRPVVYGHACLWGDPFAEDGLASGEDDTRTADGHGRVDSQTFFDAYVNFD